MEIFEKYTKNMKIIKKYLHGALAKIENHFFPLYYVLWMERRAAVTCKDRLERRDRLGARDMYLGVNSHINKYV